MPAPRGRPRGFYYEDDEAQFDGSEAKSIFIGESCGVGSSGGGGNGGVGGRGGGGSGDRGSRLSAHEDEAGGETSATDDSQRHSPKNNSETANLRPRTLGAEREERLARIRRHMMYSQGSGAQTPLSTSHH